MNKNLLKLICVLTLALGLNTSSIAQLVHIPDSAFRVYLNQNFGACMVGDSIDPSCPAVLAAKNINVSNKGISDLSGFEVFINDTTLICSSNVLSSLPTLPPSIKTITCSFNQLTALPVLPATLTYLDCGINKLVSLPSLPSLVTLDCHGNLLTSLPSLPSSLTYLSIGGNQISNLTSLPSSLKTFTCYNNQLDSLPTLPTSLNHLSASNNQFTFLSALPNSLTYLDISKNYITTLPALPTSLATLGCASNLLTSLPSLPATLVLLDCSKNQITTIPTLPPSLVNLICFKNQLTTLPLLPATLTTLKCSSNFLTTIPSLPASLNYFECGKNQITSLPELPTLLNHLNCDSNPLTCLPFLNNVTTLYFSNTLVNCLPSYGIVTTSNPSIATIPLCGVFNTNGCEVLWNIEGLAFFDKDTNCITGPNEPFLKNQKLNLYKNGVLDQQNFSNLNGDYYFDTYSFDFYKTEFDTTGLPFEVYCPSPGFYTDTISVSDSLKNDRNFGLKCKDLDLAAASIFSDNLRPASIREIEIQAGDYSNYFGVHCAAGISGTVNITITGACNYFSPTMGALTPNTVIGNVLTYNIADFGILSYDSSFNFNILVDTTAALGSQICIQVSISTTSQELNYNNNLLSQCFTVVGSFDPNDKTAFPNSTLDISGDRWLTYLIRFQNTGTASAEHIFITDTLSTALDWSTFNLLSYSHQPLTQVYNDGLVKFSFPNIHLPDSNTNEPASHGYVQYKIRAKDSLALGSTIENTANIFFDFNAPVITNTTSNTVINCSIPPTIITSSICNGETFSLNGVMYYIDGVYQQKLITSLGCDSIIELQLTVSSIINTVSQSSAILQTTAGGSAYQWIDCATNTAITGAINSIYQPTQSGDYAVAVTYGNCVDTSSCFAFSMVGLPSSIAADVIFQTRYLSNSDQIQLHAEKLKGNKGFLRLMDLSGRIIFQKQIENIAAGNLDLEIPTKGMNAGIYLVNLITERDNISGKVVKY